ncbi:MAG: hypothetical protein ACYC2U_08335 [Candidatus Amoebophilus sp.]
MPQINDILKNRKKNFVKKQYRPWDFSGEGQPEASIENNNPLLHSPFSTETDNLIDNKKVSNKDHLNDQTNNNKVTIELQTGSKEVSNRDHLDNAIDNELDNNYTYDITEEVRRLTGVQKSILLFIADICSIKGELKTGPINTYKLAEHIVSNYGIVKMSLVRLVKKGLIKRLPGKTARGGFINIEITKEVKLAAAHIKKEDGDFKHLLNSISNGNLDNELDNIVDNSNLYTSSSNKINNTTDLPDEWKKIDLEPLAHIGFSETQLMQLYEKNLNLPQVVEESINQFAFGLENNPKVKGYPDPLNVLMGVLRKGGSWTEPNYESPQQKALRELLERRKAERERLETMENELNKIEFKNWLDEMTEEDKNKLVPPEAIRLKSMRDGHLKAYFNENVWPLRKNASMNDK